MPLPLNEKIFTIDAKGNVLPAAVFAERGDRVTVTPVGTPYQGEVYAQRNGEDACAQLFGIPNLDHMTLDHAYTIAKSATPGTYVILGTIEGQKILTSTGELHVGSTGNE
jgi:hypothetical protein